ncbi:MAG: hypothetical protein ACI9KE_000236 [Polyangiales bacterium]|jgi:hypothetical protein
MASLIALLGFAWLVDMDPDLRAVLFMAFTVLFIVIGFMRGWANDTVALRLPAAETVNTRPVQRLAMEERITCSASNQATDRSWHREAVRSFRVRKRGEESFDILASVDDELVTLFRDLDPEETKVISEHLEVHLAPRRVVVPDTVRVLLDDAQGYRGHAERFVEVQSRGDRPVQRVRVGVHETVEAVVTADVVRVVAHTEAGEVSLFEELDADEAKAVVAALATED